MVKETGFQEFSLQVRALRDRLMKQIGVKRGDRVLLRFGNSPEFCLILAALWDMGATAVLLDPTESGEEMQASETAVRKDCGAVGCIAPSHPAGSEHGFFRIVPELSWFEDLPDSNPGGLSHPDDLALIVYTSGTTSKPKGVMLTQSMLMVNAEAVTRLHGMNKEHVHMCVLPMFHVNALNFSFIATLYAGSRLILNRSFYLPEFWRITEKEKPTVVSAVPSLLQMLYTDRRDIGTNNVPSSLCYFTSAAAPLSADLARGIYARFGVRVNQGYGLAEAVNFSLTVPPDLTDPEYREFFLDQPFPPAGCPVWANEMAVMGPDHTPVPDGETGQIAVRGPHVMLGYLNRNEETEAAIRDGWLLTGDTGFVRMYGGRRFYFLQGRVKEMILRKGENLFPARLDEALSSAMAELDISDYAVVGFANTLSGEEVGLAMVPGEVRLTEDKVLKECTRVLGRAKAPKAVAFVDRIPRTSTGKAQRGHLRNAFTHLEHKEYA